MSLFTVDREKCKRDGICAATCPDRVIVLAEDGFPQPTPEADAKMRQKAFREGGKWIFWYDEVPHWMKGWFGRSGAFPWVTFPYKAAPRTVEAMIKHPFKFIMWALFIRKLNQEAIKVVGFTNDEWEQALHLLPDWLRKMANSYMTIARPGKDKDGNVRLYQVGSPIPFFGILDPANEGGFMQSPTITTALALQKALQGDHPMRDPFSGRKMWDEGDNGWVNWAKVWDRLQLDLDT